MFQQSGMGLWTTFRPAEFRNMTAVVVYLKDAWVAVRTKATKSDSTEAYAFLRKQHKSAKSNQIILNPVIPCYY